MAKRANGECTVRQRANGRWEARVTLGYGPDGKQIRPTFLGDTRAEVQQLLSQSIVNRDRGVPVRNDRQTVGEFLAKWLEDSHRPNVRPSTYRRSEQDVRRHPLPSIGRIKLTKFSPTDVRALMKTKLAQGLSPRSVQIIHVTLRAALNEGVRLGDVSRNVAALVRPPRCSSKPIEPLSPEEARTFLTALHSDRLEALYVLAIATGLRQAELLGLRWADLDLDDAMLSVRYTLQRVDGNYQLVEPKTRQSRRTIALPELAVNALKSHHVRQAEERLGVGKDWTDLDLVFTTAKGQPLSGHVVYARFTRILKAAGLRPQRFHDLRHCTATLLMVQGAHPRLVMETLGHSEIGVTMNTYSHIISKLKREPAAMMDALLAVPSQA